MLLLKGSAAVTGYQFKGSVTGSAVRTFTVGPLNCTGVDLIVIGYCYYNTTTDATDSAGNTYNLSTDVAVAEAGTLNPRNLIWFKQAPAVSATQTFTFSTGQASDNFNSVVVTAWSGSLASPLDKTAHNHLGSTATIKPAAGTPVVPATINQLLFTVLSTQNVPLDVAPTIDSGFATPIGTLGGSGAGGGYPAYISYIIETAIVGKDPQWSAAGANFSTDVNSCIATFKAA